MVAFTPTVALLAALPALVASRYVIKPAAFDDLCLAPAGSSNGNGTAVVVTDCIGDLIYWDITNSTITNANTSEALDFTNGRHKNGNPMQMWEATEGNPHQAFEITARFKNDTSFSIQWSEERYCLDLKDGQGVANTTVQAWRCAKSNINQKWNFYDVTEASAAEAVDEEDDAAAVYNAYLASLFAPEAPANATEEVAPSASASDAEAEAEATIFGQEQAEATDPAAVRRRHNRNRRVVTFGSH